MRFWKKDDSHKTLLNLVFVESLPKRIELYFYVTPGHALKLLAVKVAGNISYHIEKYSRLVFWENQLFQLCSFSSPNYFSPLTPSLLEPFPLNHAGSTSQLHLLLWNSLGLHGKWIWREREKMLPVLLRGSVTSPASKVAILLSLPSAAVNVVEKKPAALLGAPAGINWLYLSNHFIEKYMIFLKLTSITQAKL